MVITLNYGDIHIEISNDYRYHYSQKYSLVKSNLSNYVELHVAVATENFLLELAPLFRSERLQQYLKAIVESSHSKLENSI